MSEALLKDKPKTQQYQAQALTTLTEFLPLKKEWDQLVEASDVKDVFACHDWLRLWCEHFQKKDLFIVTVRDGAGQLVGAVPLKIARVKRGLNRRLLRAVQFIGTEPSLTDRMDIIVAPRANAGQVIDAIAAELKLAAGAWDVLDLRYSDEEALRRLRKALGEVLHSGEVEETMSCPYFVLPESFETYHADNKKNRKKYKRHKKLTDRDFGELGELRLRYLAPDEVAPHLSAMANKHKEYWAERGIVSNFARYPQMERFYLDLLSTFPSTPETPGRVSLALMAVGDKVLAYDMGMNRTDGYMGHMGTFDGECKRYGPGFMIRELLVKSGIERNQRCFYFGRGDEEFKNNWANHREPLFNLRAFRTPVGQLLWQADSVLKRLAGKADE